MTTVTLPGMYDHGMIRSLNKVKNKPSRIYILLDYSENGVQNNKKKATDLNALVGVINTDFKRDYNEALLHKYA